MARPSSSLVLALVVSSAASLAAQTIPTRQGIIDHMNWAATTYPSICKLYDLNATYGAPLTHQGRNIYALKISDNVAVDEDEESFMMVGAHHGNEVGTPVVALDTITRLATGYGVDPQITDLVDNREIWIAPLWNQDGYPNSRNNARPGSTVDLNRNYPFLWASACNTGVRGPSPASEPETQTMLAWSRDQRFTKVLDFHSSGREVLFGYRQSCGQHVLGAYMQAEAIELSFVSSYGGANRQPSSNGEHYHWQIGEFSNYAFLTEISNTQSPSYLSAVMEAERVWPGTVWMLERPIPVWGHVVDANTGRPVEANIDYVEHPFTFGETNTAEPRYGRYHAFLPNGNKTLRFSHPCYVTQDVAVAVTGAGLQVEVSMVPLCAACAERNGNGINPTGYACITSPVLGTNWDTAIATNGSTVATYLGLSLAPSQIPILGGELLIDVSVAFFQPGNGLHTVPIPNDPALLSAALYTQGLRIDVFAGNPFLILLNAQDVTLGNP